MAVNELILIKLVGIRNIYQYGINDDIADGKYSFFLQKTTRN